MITIKKCQSRKEMVVSMQQWTFNIHTEAHSSDCDVRFSTRIRSHEVFILVVKIHDISKFIHINTDLIKPYKFFEFIIYFLAAPCIH